ncbi:MAG: hypothetical protein FGM24_10145 [Candidatus Kapabacteria bacterium]|nr:hypothetical protein [Candidatus Kapabacteria bacterium]
MMRRLTIALTMVFAVSTAAAQVVGEPPLLLSFQGLLVRPDGTIFPDAQYTLNVRLYDVDTLGTRVWEDNISTTVVKGIFNLILGEQIPLKDNVDFTKQLWLEIALPDALNDPFKPRTKLTASPYAAVARTATYAGALLPGATGVVRTLEGAEGDINLEGTGGVTITRNGQDVTIDASGVLGNLTLATKDNVVQVEKDVNADNTWKFYVRDQSLDSTQLKSTGVISDIYGDSTAIARLIIGRDGRIKAASRVSVPQRPKNMIPNRILVSGPDGTLTEGDRLDSLQIYMGRPGGVPKRTQMKAGNGIQLTQNADTLLISATNTVELPPLHSGRHTNNTAARQYDVAINVNAAFPAMTALKANARVVVTMESAEGISAYTISNRTANGFTVTFSGGLPVGAAFSWMILNYD